MALLQMLLEGTLNIVYYTNRVHRLLKFEMCSHDSELSVKQRNIHGREPGMSRRFASHSLHLQT